MSQPSPPEAPDYSKQFKEGLQTWIKFLPKMLNKEWQARKTEDPRRIEWQQYLQGKYGPTQYNQQLQALKQLDPTGYAMREGLGATIGQMLGQGYVDPTQAGIYGQLGKQVQANLARGGIDPTQIAAYKALGQGSLGEYNRGYAIDPSLQRELMQTINARQGVTGNFLGRAPAMAAAVYQGQRAQQLRQQRTQNLQEFLGLQAPEAAALQSAYAFQGLQTPQEKALAQSGSFLSLPTPIQQIQGIQGVSPDRSFAYMNPNAGPQGVQFGLQNYANQYAGYNPTNPWMNALSGAASGASSGAMFGGGYGAIAGGLIGGVGGYFSDPRMKKDVKRLGSIPIYEYRYKAKFGIPGTFRGPMSTDVKKLAPEAVQRVLGHDFVRSPNSLGLNRVKVKEE